MAKKSHKHSLRLRKENSSCMGGLISMFDFRQGRSSKRLLSDKKHGNARILGISSSSSIDDLSCSREENHGEDENLANLSDTEADEVNLGVTSIKALMEEEMSRTHLSIKESSSEIECLKAELRLEANGEKNHNECAKSTLVGSDDHDHHLNISTKLISQRSDYPDISEVLTSDIDVAAVIVDYCRTSFQLQDNKLEFKNQTDQYSSRVSAEDLQKNELYNESVAILQKAIVDIAKVLLKQKSTNSTKLVENTVVQQQDEFSDALEMLNSNRELFIRLLEDPNSPIRKHIEGLQNAHSSKSSKIDENQLFGEFRKSKHCKKQNGHHFFRKKRDKITVSNQSNECRDAKVVNRIVVLKPSLVRNQNPSNTICPISSIQSHCCLENKEDREKLSSHFSLKEIGKRFRNAVGASKKERRSISMDGILHKIPYGGKISSENEISCRRKVIESEDEKNSNAKGIQKKKELSFSTTIFCENKKLNKDATPQMLHREAAFYDETRNHLSEFLRMEIKTESAIQESKSLGRILSFSGFKYIPPRFSPAREKEPESSQEKASILICHSNQNFDTKYLSLSRQKESSPNSNESLEAEKGSMQITELEECAQIGENSQVETQFVSISNEDDRPSGLFKEEKSPMLEDSAKFEERFLPSTPLTASSSVVPQEPRDLECAIDNGCRPSPISVLEPLYFDDISSPSRLIIEHGTNSERKTQPTDPQSDTSAAASGSIDFESDTKTCFEFDEASLFDELERSYGLLINDPKFLFDLIDEVVTEMKERHISCNPWVSVIKPSIRPLQKQEDFINEACRRINWHLDVRFSTTSEQAVKKDFDGGAWFDLQLEAEDAVNELGNEILDYLFEEIALELWD